MSDRLIRRLAIMFTLMYVRRKVNPRTAAIAGAGVLAGIAAIGVAGYVATRDVPEA